MDKYKLTQEKTCQMHCAQNECYNQNNECIVCKEDCQLKCPKSSDKPCEVCDQKLRVETINTCQEGYLENDLCKTMDEKVTTGKIVLIAGLFIFITFLTSF